MFYYGNEQLFVLLISLHVVRHIDGVQLVRQETVSQMHALFFSTRVDGNNSWINHHDYTDDQVMLFQHGVCHEGNQIQGFALVSVQFYHHDEQVCPSKDSAEIAKG